MMMDSEYILTTANDNLPLRKFEVNDHLKEDFPDIPSEPLVAPMIRAVEKYGEDFTKKIFLNKTFTNYRTCWEWNYVLRLGNVNTINSVKYIDENEDLQTVDPANYSLTISSSYRSIYFASDFSFPSLSMNTKQPIIIDFVAGFGETDSSIPGNIKAAMLNHLAMLWSNRGDCNFNKYSDYTSMSLTALPPTSRIIYSMERIMDIIL